eukprot:648432-Pyramimonas_sp.AAC.1
MWHSLSSRPWWCHVQGLRTLGLLSPGSLSVGSSRLHSPSQCEIFAMLLVFRAWGRHGDLGVARSASQFALHDLNQYYQAHANAMPHITRHRLITDMHLNMWPSREA